jgi:proline dehydrogenase
LSATVRSRASTRCGSTAERPSVADEDSACGRVDRAVAGRRWHPDLMGVDRALLFRLATSERLQRAAKAVPGGEASAWRVASRYVAGRSCAEALNAAGGLLERGHGVSVDLFGELVRDSAVAAGVVEDYLSLAAALPKPPADAWLSVDLTHLALDTDPSGAANRLATVAAGLPPGRRLQVGAEDAARTDAVLSCVLDVAERGLADRLGATVQANLLRSPDDADVLTGAGVHVRLVKGAYLEAGGVHPYGEPTDIAFLRLSFRLAETGATWSMATHDGRLREALLLALGPIPVEQLLGVRPEVLDRLHERDVPTRVYLPYGPDWFRYWLRRLAESRGA